MLRFSDAKSADRSRNPSQQSVGSESDELEHRKPQRIECGEFVRSNGAREAERGPTENGRGHGGAGCLR
jgi:hypothetical protein